MMKRRVVSLCISVCITAFLFLFPFPGFLLPSRKESVKQRKIAVRNFSLMDYTVMTNRTEDSRLVKKETVNRNTVETDRKRSAERDSEPEDGENPSPENKEKGPEDTGKEKRGGKKERGKPLPPNTVNYRPDFTVNAMPVYPVAARRMRQEGAVALKIVTDGSGTILSVTVENSTGFALLDNAAVTAVHKWDFSSIVVAGRVNIIRTEIVFRLTGK